MSIQSGAEVQPAGSHPASVVRRPRARWPMLVLGAGWLIFLVLAAPALRVHSSYGHLVNDVVSGNVDEVTIEGFWHEPRGRGSVLRQVTWRSGLVLRTATVREDYRQRPSRVTDTSVSGSVDGDLRRLDPRIRLVHREFVSGPSLETTRWLIWGWPVGVLYGLWLVTFGIIAVGPIPHSASRWAWAWLMFSPVAPLVGAAFAWLNRSGQPATRPPRLTGGWAFLLLLVLGPIAR